MDTRAAAQRWADVWQRGWQEHDAAAISALYADGACADQARRREHRGPAGVSLLRFDSDGLVTEHRDFWNAG